MNKGTQKGIIYAVAIIALVAVIYYFANGGQFTIVPSFLAGHSASINSTGVYVQSGSTTTGWQNYYSIYGFQLDRATVGGQNVQLTVPTHALGNGAYGLYQCPYHPSVYYVLTGTGMPAPDTWKIFELNNPSTLVTVDYRYVVKDAVSSDAVNNNVYEICGGGYDLQGNPTGAPIKPFVGTAVNLSKDFSTQQPPVCNNNGVCDTGETTSNCPTDCHTNQAPVCGDKTCNGLETCSSCSGDCGACVAPPQDNTMYVYGLIGLAVLAGSAYMILSRKK